MDTLTALLAEVRACSKCAGHLPLGPRPVLQLHPSARILVAAQAPGRKVHETGIPFNDASGDRLRAWLGIPRDDFYDCRKVAILPMGFCYPGSAKSGDKPPRPECAKAWRAGLMGHLKNVELTLVIGRYALAYHLPGEGRSVTDAVRQWPDGRPTAIPLPHPSPRNNGWLKRNPWFEAQVLPKLRDRVAEVLTRPRRSW
jgi:uracil-DNA glycosylase